MKEIWNTLFVYFIVNRHNKIYFCLSKSLWMNYVQSLYGKCELRLLRAGTWHWYNQTSASPPGRQKAEFLPNKHHKKCSAKKLWRFPLVRGRWYYIPAWHFVAAASIKCKPFNVLLLSVSNSIQSQTATKTSLKTSSLHPNTTGLGSEILG